jgi:hypothetical protein
MHKITSGGLEKSRRGVVATDWAEKGEEKKKSMMDGLLARGAAWVEKQISPLAVRKSANGFGRNDECEGWSEERQEQRKRCLWRVEACNPTHRKVRDGWSTRRVFVIGRIQRLRLDD